MKSNNLWITFWPIWILANALGWFGISAIYILPFWGVWATVGVSFFLSLLHWQVLQKFIGVDIMWLWLSTITYGLFLFVVIFISRDNTFFTVLIVGFLCLGLLGFLQRISLNYALDRANVWLVASPTAGITAMVLANIFGGILGNNSLTLFWTITGVVYGLLTGAVIVALRNYTLGKS